LAVLAGQTPDRVPTDIWAVPEVWAKLRRHFGPGADVMERLHIDGFAGAGPDYVGPPLPAGAAEGVLGYWGVRTRKMDYQGGQYDEISHYPLADAMTIDDLEAYAWPRADWFDFGDLAQRLRPLHQRQATQCGYMAPFTFHIYLRGLENALTDPLLEPEFTRRLLGHLCDFFYDFHRRMFQAGEGLIDMAQVTDDYGMQTGPMMSLETFRRFYKPHLKRFCDLTHEFGAKVFHHDDGAMRAFLPDLLDIGIDLLNPIQWRCPGMDMEGLKRDFGHRLVFHGGIDNQRTLPFGSPADVRAEVRRAIDTLACDRTRYVLAPCHNIQANTSVENIVALYDEAYHYGRWGG
jgi:uroporphyrinogen decarboxylase